MIYDSNFLVVLAGQSKSIPLARATGFLARHRAAPSYVSRVSVMEFSAGVANATLAARHLEPFTLLPVDDAIWALATDIFRDLRRAGLPIGVPDTLIAATGLIYGIPVVSNNVKHFVRVKGLKVYEF